MSNYSPPIATYPHGGGDQCVIGGYVYRGGKWGDLFGYYFYVDTYGGRMRSIKSDGSGGWIINNNVGTFTLAGLNIQSFHTFGEDRYGELYLSRNANSGNSFTYKIVGTTCKPTAVITYNNTIPDTINICKGTPVTLKAVFGDSLTYQWKRNGTNIPSATLLTYSTDSVGSYSVFVTNASSCTNTSAAVVLVDTCVSIGIAGNKSFSKTKISPNPTSGKISIETKEKEYVLIITNVLGEKVFFQKIQKEKSEIDLSKQPNGIYFLKLETPNGQFTQKLIIQK